MIVDHIGNAARYAVFGPLFERAFAFLREEDIEALPTRRHEILGDRLFALVQQYPPSRWSRVSGKLTGATSICSSSCAVASASVTRHCPA